MLVRPTRTATRKTVSHKVRAVPIWSCSRWGLPCHFCHQKRGALLPHPFTLTSFLAVYFLWHFPWDFSRWTLSSTFLPWSPDFPLGVKPSGHPASRQRTVTFFAHCTNLFLYKCLEKRVFYRYST